jgi:hypothetical protein
MGSVKFSRQRNCVQEMIRKERTLPLLCYTFPSLEGKNEISGKYVANRGLSFCRHFLMGNAREILPK